MPNPTTMTPSACGPEARAAIIVEKEVCRRRYGLVEESPTESDAPPSLRFPVD